MKHLILFISLTVTLQSISQQTINYKDWLAEVKEVSDNDSLQINIPADSAEPVSPEIIKQFIFPLYQEPSGIGMPTQYYFTGKLTRNPDYDIVLLYINKKNSAQVEFKQMFLVTFSKEGKQLHFERVASDNVWANVTDKSASILVKDSFIIKNGTRKLGNEIFSFKGEYSITHHGIVVPSKYR